MQERFQIEKAYTVLNVFLCLFFSYCLLCYLFSSPDRYIRFFIWKMFTGYTKTHAVYHAYGEFGDKNVFPIDLDKEFPAMWDSGPAYEWVGFVTEKKHMRVLLSSLCKRHPEAKRIIFEKHKYPIIRGAVFDINVPYRKKVLMRHLCE